MLLCYNFVSFAAGLYRVGKKVGLKPKYVELKRHRLPTGKILKAKAGTQVIDRCWKYGPTVGVLNAESPKRTFPNFLKSNLVTK